MATNPCKTLDEILAAHTVPARIDYAAAAVTVVTESPLQVLDAFLAAYSNQNLPWNELCQKAVERNETAKFGMLCRYGGARVTNWLNLAKKAIWARAVSPEMLVVVAFYAGDELDGYWDELGFTVIDEQNVVKFKVVARLAGNKLLDWGSLQHKARRDPGLERAVAEVMAERKIPAAA